MSAIDSLETFINTTNVTFDDAVIGVCSKIANELLKSTVPELVALGYFFRYRRIEQFKKQYSCQSNLRRFPVGTVLHYAPSNVGTMFAYSWMLSFLCGNANIVRLSKNADDKQRLTLDIIKKHLGEFGSNNVFVYATHDDNDALAKSADLRVLWGSDESITNIRKSCLRPSARDLVFSHRYSVAVAHSTCIDEKSCHKLVSDIIAFDQNACTCPRAVILFDSSLDDRLKSCELAKGELLQDSSHLRLRWIQCAQAKFDVSVTMNDLCSRVFVVTLNDDCEESRKMFKYLMDTHPTHNSVIKFISDNDHASVSNVLDRHLQTIVDCDIVSSSATREFATHCNPFRIVRPGDSMKFDIIWDGKDLIEEFTNRMRIM
jgi:hypothetical protein